MKEEEVWRLAEAAELSEFYFRDDIAQKMQQLVEQSLELLSLSGAWRDAREYDPDKASALVAPRHNLMREIRDACYKLTDNIKHELRIGDK